MAITQHCGPVGVLLSSEEYDRLGEHGCFVSSIREGLSDAEAGRVITDEEIGERLDQAFGLLDPRMRPRARAGEGED